MTSLQQLLSEELKDLYSAEKQIVKALPKMTKSAQAEELRAALTEHMEATRTHVERLEEIFAALEEKPKAKHCKGMEGLLAEGAECLESDDRSAIRDLRIISAAQRVEHYEVSAYGTARTIAEQLGHDDVVKLLEATLKEEEDADSTLTRIAMELYSEVGDSGSGIARRSPANGSGKTTHARAR